MLSGRRLDGKKPTTKGVYIHDGKKMQMFGGTPENQISDEDDIM